MHGFLPTMIQRFGQRKRTNSVTLRWGQIWQDRSSNGVPYICSHSPYPAKAVKLPALWNRDNLALYAHHLVVWLKHPLALLSKLPTGTQGSHPQYTKLSESRENQNINNPEICDQAIILALSKLSSGPTLFNDWVIDQCRIKRRPTSVVGFPGN